MRRAISGTFMCLRVQQEWLRGSLFSRTSRALPRYREGMQRPLGGPALQHLGEGKVETTPKTLPAHLGYTDSSSMCLSAPVAINILISIAPVERVPHFVLGSEFSDPKKPLSPFFTNPSQVPPRSVLTCQPQWLGLKAGRAKCQGKSSSRQS